MSYIELEPKKVPGPGMRSSGGMILRNGPCDRKLALTVVNYLVSFSKDISSDRPCALHLLKRLGNL